MADTGPDTILLDLFRTNQVRERLIAAALDGLELPPEDYPFYVLVGAEGPCTPTACADRVQRPLSTVLFRVKRLDKRGPVGPIADHDDRRADAHCPAAGPAAGRRPGRLAAPPGRVAPRSTRPPRRRRTRR